MVIIDIASVEHRVFDGILTDLAKLGDKKIHEDHMSVDGQIWTVVITSVL